jgi:hypothetical protein
MWVKVLTLRNVQVKPENAELAWCRQGVSGWGGQGSAFDRICHQDAAGDR